MRKGQRPGAHWMRSSLRFCSAPPWSLLGGGQTRSRSLTSKRRLAPLPTRAVRSRGGETCAYNRLATPGQYIISRAAEHRDSHPTLSGKGQACNIRMFRVMGTTPLPRAWMLAPPAGAAQRPPGRARFFARSCPRAPLHLPRAIQHRAPNLRIHAATSSLVDEGFAREAQGTPA